MNTHRHSLLAAAILLPVAGLAAPVPDPLTPIATFDGTNGANPGGGLLAGPQDTLFGTTAFGGKYGYGTVYRLNPPTRDGRHLIVLHSFNGNDGAFPGSSLVADATGVLYGTTFNSITAYGSIFRTDPATGATTALYAFSNGTDGGMPNAELILDGQGNAYGTTTEGALGYGTVFKFNIASGQLTTLHTFDFTNGGYPYTGLVFDASGKLWGTAPAGGANGGGVLYQVDPVTMQYTIEYSFSVATGDTPESGLTIGPDGLFYGTTALGGNAADCVAPGSTFSGCGTAYKFDPATQALTVIYTFTGGPDGGTPEARLVFGPHGDLFGTTYLGGLVQDCTAVASIPPGCGTVFRLDPASGTLTTLHAFTGGADGGNLFAPVIFGKRAAILGVTNIGGNVAACPSATGNPGCGTVFRIGH